VAPPRIADQVGRVLGGRFRLVAPIGTGASAHVYVAEDVKLGRRVAVKVLHPALAQDETFLRRFRAEAQAVAALRHPHVMQVFDWGEDDDGPYLILEYLSGGSLRDLLDRGHRLSPSQALLVGLHAAEALDYAHRRGLVHRDIKPANLLFDDEARLVIADFGLARALAEAAWTEPAGAIVGSARYASPEQARGSRVDGKADVYSLALVLVEAVTGSVPFAADTTIATLMARLDQDLAAPAAFGPMAAAIEGAGRALPDDRIDAAEFTRRLNAAAVHLSRPDPLPLRAADDDSGRARQERAVFDGDITILPPPAPAPVPGAAPADASPAGPHVAPPSSAVADAPAEGAGAGAAASPRRGRGRRVLLVLASLVVAAAIAGGAFAASVAARPKHAVPDLHARMVVDARAAVHNDHFTITESGRVNDEDVPAGAVVRQSPAAGGRAREGTAISVVVSKGPVLRTVPDLTGKTVPEVAALLTDRRLVLQQHDEFSDAIAAGVVSGWAPKGDVPRDSVVAVTFSKGKQPKQIPTLGDRLVDTWRKALEALGFRTKQDQAFSDDVPAGQVITSSPAPNDSATTDQEVTIVVSKGPDLVAVPDVSGLSVADADTELRRVGLYASAVQGSPVRTVRSSDPGAGHQVKRGAGVVLITRGG
jgi:beta-lactam-binding protein with PASTA domain/tRNA A-37 threonylcarbamoyl transferase component Bud32